MNKAKQALKDNKHLGNLHPRDFEEGEVQGAYESGVDPVEFALSKLESKYDRIKSIQKSKEYHSNPENQEYQSELVFEEGSPDETIEDNV